MIKFCRATIDDLDQIYNIYMHQSVNPYMNFPLMDKSKFLSAYQDIYEDLIIWQEQDPIHAVIMVKKKNFRCSHVAYISKFAVNPNIQNQGVGTKFLQNLMDKLKQEGIKRVELMVEIDNPNAIKFYKKLGFEIEGTMKQYFNRDGEYIDDYFMAKVL